MGTQVYGDYKRGEIFDRLLINETHYDELSKYLENDKILNESL